MELRAYLAIIWRRKWVIITTTIITVMVTTLGLLFIPAIYTASTTLRVAPIGSRTGGQVGWDDFQYSDRLMNTYRNIATSPPVLQELAQRLGHNRQPKVEVEIPANTELMQLTVEDQDSFVAKKAADTLAEILIARVRMQYAGGGKTAQEILKEQLDQAEKDVTQARSEYESLLTHTGNSAEHVQGAERVMQLKEGIYADLLNQYEQVRITDALRANTIIVLDAAVLPSAPSSPRKTLYSALGLLLGFVGGLGLAFLLENLDTKLYTSRQIEDAVTLPVLGRIPFRRSAKHVAIFKKDSSQADDFLRLGSSIAALHHDAAMQSFLFTSSEPREGKSAVVVNVACALAEAGYKVIVVDADLRKPTLHTIFGVPNQLGICSALREHVPVDEALQETLVPGLRVLVSGAWRDNSATLLTLHELPKFIEELARLSDIVLFDSPALLAVSDTALLARAVDGVALVVRRGHARQQTVRSALEQLANVKAHSIGLVICWAEQDGVQKASYYPEVGDRQTQPIASDERYRNQNIGIKKASPHIRDRT